MAMLLVDEDIPRFIAHALRQAGHEVLDIHELGLRGQPDQVIFDKAIEEGAILLTADKGFYELPLFARVQHPGLVLVRLPEEIPLPKRAETVVRALESLSPEEAKGAVIVIEPGRVRTRRPSV